MKILFVCEAFPLDKKLKFSGGVESYNYYLAKELAKKNQLIVICRKSQEKKEKVGDENLKIVAVGPLINQIDTSFKTIPGRFIFMIRALLAGLKEDFEVVQGNNFVVYPIAFLVGFLKGKPKIAWYADVFLGNWIEHAGFISGLIGEMVERLVLSLPWNYFVALSKSTEQKLIKAGVEKNKIRTILAGVDVEYFRKLRPKKSKTLTIICISRLVSYKRVDLLIEACKILRDKGVNFKLNIIGDGPEKEKINKLINEKKLASIVKIESKFERDELARRLKSANILCHPSEQEGFGLVVIEAAACGVPFVVSDLEVLKEITKNGKGGLIFKKGNVKDLAKKLESLLVNETKRQALGRDGLGLAKEYSWEKVAKQFLEVYEEN